MKESIYNKGRISNVERRERLRIQRQKGEWALIKMKDDKSGRWMYRVCEER